MLLLREILPIALTNGNEGRTKHFGSAAARRKKYERQLRQLGLVRGPFTCQVDVLVTRILGPGQREWDSSSVLSGNYKEIEDALVACGWYVDDGPGYIRITLPRQDSTRRDIGPATMIEVFSVGAIKIWDSEV
jgi:hypothetical protein